MLGLCVLITKNPKQNWVQLVIHKKLQIARAMIYLMLCTLPCLAFMFRCFHKDTDLEKHLCLKVNNRACYFATIIIYDKTSFIEGN
jgi:hypothetical protein